MSILLQYDNQHYGIKVVCKSCNTGYLLETPHGTEPNFCAICGVRITKCIWCSPEYPRWIRNLSSDWKEQSRLLDIHRNARDRNRSMQKWKIQNVKVDDYGYEQITICRYLLDISGKWVISGKWAMGKSVYLFKADSMHSAMAVIESDIKMSQESFMRDNDNFKNIPEHEDDYVEDNYWEVNQYKYGVTIGGRTLFVRQYNEWDLVPDTHKRYTHKR